MPFTAKQKKEAADREVGHRLRVYSRLVDKGVMTAKKAHYEIDIMRAIASDYQALAETERLV